MIRENPIALIRRHKVEYENSSLKSFFFTCPGDRFLKYDRSVSYTTRNGYESFRRLYECASCADYQFFGLCMKKVDCKSDRVIRVSHRLWNYHKNANEKLNSEKGLVLRKLRSVEVESVYSQIKGNRGFRRFSLRGLEKVKTEWGVLSITHNMLKLTSDLSDGIWKEKKVQNELAKISAEKKYL